MTELWGFAVVAALVVLAWPLGAYIQRRVDRHARTKKSERFREFTNVTQKLGIERVDGTMVYQGYRLRAGATSPAVSLLRCSGPPVPFLELSNVADPGRGLDFDTGNPRFDRFFQLRIAVPELALGFQNHPDDVEEIAQVIGRWQGRLAGLRVSGEALEVTALLPYAGGGSGLVYAPVQTLESLLPDLVIVISRLEVIAGMNREAEKPP